VYSVKNFIVILGAADLNLLKPDPPVTVKGKSSRVEEVKRRVAPPPKKRCKIYTSSDSEPEPELVDQTILAKEATLPPMLSRLECKLLQQLLLKRMRHQFY